MCEACSVYTSKSQLSTPSGEVLRVPLKITRPGALTRIAVPAQGALVTKSVEGDVQVGCPRVRARVVNRFVADSVELVAHYRMYLPDLSDDGQRSVDGALPLAILDPSPFHQRAARHLHTDVRSGSAPGGVRLLPGYANKCGSGFDTVMGRLQRTAGHPFGTRFFPAVTSRP